MVKWYCLAPLLGLLAGVKAHFKLIALVISYSENPKVRYDTGFSLGPFNINKSQFCCPYVVTPFGLLAGVKPRMKLLALAIPYYGNLKARYDTVFSLGPFNINKIPFVTPFGVAVRGKASHEIACIVHFVLMEPKWTNWHVFILGPLNINKSSLFGYFKGWFWGESPTPNLPAIDFRDIDGYSNQPIGPNLLALLAWLTVLCSRSITQFAVHLSA